MLVLVDNGRSVFESPLLVLADSSPWVFESLLLVLADIGRWVFESLLLVLADHGPWALKSFCWFWQTMAQGSLKAFAGLAGNGPWVPESLLLVDPGLLIDHCAPCWTCCPSLVLIESRSGADRVPVWDGNEDAAVHESLHPCTIACIVHPMHRKPSWLSGLVQMPLRL